jgi:hypothetical protein
VTDLSNRKTIRRLEKEAAISGHNRIVYTRQIMREIAGREWMHDLLTRCNAFHTPFVGGQPDMTAFNCGGHNVGIQIFLDVVKYCPAEYILMMQEQAAKEEVDGNRDDDDTRADPAAATTRSLADPGRDDNRRERDPADFVDEHGFVLSRPN